MIIWLLKFILIHNIFRILFHLISCFCWCTSRPAASAVLFAKSTWQKDVKDVDLDVAVDSTHATWTRRGRGHGHPWPLGLPVAGGRPQTDDLPGAMKIFDIALPIRLEKIHQMRKENGNSLFQVSNIIAIAMCQGNMKICIRCSIHAFLTEVHPAAGSFWPKWRRERERLHRSVAMNCLGTLWRRTQLDT